MAELADSFAFLTQRTGPFSFLQHLLTSVFSLSLSFSVLWLPLLPYPWLCRQRLFCLWTGSSCSSPNHLFLGVALAVPFPPSFPEGKLYTIMLPSQGQYWTKSRNWFNSPLRVKNQLDDGTFHVILKWVLQVLDLCRKPIVTQGSMYFAFFYFFMSQC